MTATETDLRVIANRSALASILQCCGSVVNQRSPKPVLSCVRLDADNDMLKIMASDLEVSVVYELTQCQVESIGSICVPADRLKDSVAKSNGETVDLSIKGEKLRVSDDSGEANIVSMPASEYPPYPEGIEGSKIEVAGNVLQSAILKTSFGASTDANRYAFNGLFFDLGTKQATLVSADGKRMPLMTIDAKCAEPRAGIIPMKAVKMLTSMIEDDSEITVTLGTNQVRFAGPGWILTSNLIEGTFPPYKDFVPQNNRFKLTVGAEALLSAVERAALMSDEIKRGVRVNLSKKGAILSAICAGKGDATINLPCKYDGDDMTIGLNPDFIVDAVKASGAEEVTIHLDAPNKAVKFTTPDPNWVYVLMPVNLE